MARAPEFIRAPSLRARTEPARPVRLCGRGLRGGPSSSSASSLLRPQSCSALLALSHSSAVAPASLRLSPACVCLCCPSSLLLSLCAWRYGSRSCRCRFPPLLFLWCVPSPHQPFPPPRSSLPCVCALALAARRGCRDLARLARHATPPRRTHPYTSRQPRCHDTATLASGRHGPPRGAMARQRWRASCVARAPWRRSVSAEIAIDRWNAPTGSDGTRGSQSTALPRAPR